MPTTCACPSKGKSVSCHAVCVAGLQTGCVSRHPSVLYGDALIFIIFFFSKCGYQFWLRTLAPICLSLRHFGYKMACWQIAADLRGSWVQKEVVYFVHSIALCEHSLVGRSFGVNTRILYSGGRAGWKARNEKKHVMYGRAQHTLPFGVFCMCSAFRKWCCPLTKGRCLPNVVQEKTK